MFAKDASPLISCLDLTKRELPNVSRMSYLRASQEGIAVASANCRVPLLIIARALENGYHSVQHHTPIG